MKKINSKNKKSDEVLNKHKKRTERFEFVKQRLLNVDIEEVWSKLEKDLVTCNNGKININKLYKSLDECEENLRRAGMIVQVAIQEYDDFELHYRSAYSGWSRFARNSLERDKKEKRTSGQITQDMVENWIAENIVDYIKWNEVKIDLKRNKNLTKQMFQAWESRSATLRKQVDLVERKGVSLDMLPRRDKNK